MLLSSILLYIFGSSGLRCRALVKRKNVVQARNCFPAAIEIVPSI